MSLQKALKEASEQAQAQEAERLKQHYIDYHSAIFGTATAYDNVIVLAGFAGFFALWAGAADDIPQFARLVTVSLMGVSLILYVTATVGQMLLRQYHLEWRRGKAFEKFAKDAKAFNAQWEQIGRDYDLRHGRYMRVHAALFWGSLASGYAAGIILAYNALAVAFGWPALIGG